MSSLSRSSRFFLFVLVLSGVFAMSAAISAEEVEFTYTNSFDGSTQPAMAYIPDAVKGKGPVPLVVLAHPMMGSRLSARYGRYYPQADAHGWMIVCPQLHGLRTGGETSMASLGAQHDIIDCIAYMKKNYAVDSTRVYLVGRSMGGMLSAVMAAKYPDVFAAVVAGQGIYDLRTWTDTTIPRLYNRSLKECLAYSDSTRFDYERRSAVSYATNFAYVPIILWHGTADGWVPVEQSEMLYAAMKKYDRFMPEPVWLRGAAHYWQNFTPAWEFEQFVPYQNKAEFGYETPTRSYADLNITTDEAKAFFWLGITPAASDDFARVHAGFADGLLSIGAERASVVTIDAGLVPKIIPCSRFSIRADAPVTLTVIRDGESVFETTETAGVFPESLFVRP